MKIKSLITLHAFILTGALALMPFSNSFGQLFNPNPYKIYFTNLDIEHTKKEVVSNKIKRVSSKEYEIKNKKLGKEIPKSDFYIIEFNEAGNPVKYYYKDYRSKSDEYDGLSEIFTYVFEYDSLGKLIHIQEYELHSTIPYCHYEIDVYFFYDENNKLIREAYTRKFIYDPDYKFKGKDNTSTKQYVFNYSDSGTVSTVFSEGYATYDEEKWYDTLTFNCSFDSVFVEKYIPRGVKKDSEGRVIENTSYAIHALLRGGGCVSPDSPHDIITKYYYGNNGKLVKSVSHSRKGKLVRRKRWTYNEKGLLQSIQVEHSEKITMYEYEFY
ncbi:hypothetical protein [Cytophaga aurantiaca]|uniref:hypothetical protein n=1 Tax=Cytophaga aurantiaca TaxID=29530 RepID=UPI00036C40C2|nr:hypothetical protein [Cytophaga aurantiaca]